ncbi:MAG: hypothetical protein M3046_02010 [Actinomycetota bacterium]|nr:hypothetical protein [Actinomycetota bacterium]
MALVILVGGFGLVVAGVVVVWATGDAHPESEDADKVLLEARGDAQPSRTQHAPWSPFELAALRDAVASVDQRDPFRTLSRVNSPVSGDNRSSGNGTAPARIVWRRPARQANSCRSHMHATSCRTIPTPLRS